MRTVHFEGCKGLTGTLVTLPPPSIKTFDVRGSGVKIDVAAIEWPANATALVCEDDALVCRTTDPDESKEGAETSEIRILCQSDQVIGDIDKLMLPEGMQKLVFAGCGKLAGDVGKLVLPVGMQTVDFRNCKGLAGEIAHLNLPVGMQTVNVEGCEGLTGCLSWHCHVEPKVGDRILGKNYDSLMPEDIEPYLNGRSWEDLKVGDEIAFPDTEPIQLTAQLTALYEVVDASKIPTIPNILAKYKGNEPKLLERLAAKYPAHARRYSKAFKGVCIIRNIGQLNLPVGMEYVNFFNCKGLKGAVDKLLLPKGMQTAEFGNCTGLTGDIVQLKLPVGMQSVNFQNCKGLTGDISQLNLPVGMKTVDFVACWRLTGDIGQLNLPVGMKEVNFFNCKGITGAVDKLVLPEGMQAVTFAYCYGLTGNIGWLDLPVGVQSVSFYNCRGVTGKLRGSERAKTKNYSGP